MNRRLIFIIPLLLASAVRAEWRHENREECDRIDQKLQDVQNQRRMGYTAKRGRKLHEQQDKLEQKRREKCR